MIMTHSLHRQGNLDKLKHDYVWQPYPTQNVNDDKNPENFSVIIDLVEELGSVNWGDIKTGPKASVEPKTIKEKLKKESRIRGVFTEKTQVVEFLKKMKKLDLGLSLVISGLTDDVLDACNQAELKPHSINLSLGIWGKKELLPPNEILEITTMCGHHMVSTNIVKATAEIVRSGKLTPEKAGKELAKLCPCGIFNPDRASDVLKTHYCQCKQDKKPG
jgi:hypothetical protein